ncbi:hypothetical protein [Amphritea japonica]|uniref:hypothetical protein n=1 Tax=Amphritea japonica TaxID=452627 RepID=UPI000364136B|nr:hypothetical protein [Amphritea japonica]
MDKKSKKILRITVYSLAIILPLMATFNCSGWGTNDMSVSQCIIDTSFLRLVSESLYGVLFISIFLLGAPVIVYAVFIILLVEGVIYLSSKKQKKEALEGELKG